MNNNELVFWNAFFPMNLKKLDYTGGWNYENYTSGKARIVSYCFVGTLYPYFELCGSSSVAVAFP